MIWRIIRVYKRFLVEELILELKRDRAALTDYLHLIGHSDILLAFTCKPLGLRSVNINDMILFK